jgi:hypothetical protein
VRLAELGSCLTCSHDGMVAGSEEAGAQGTTHGLRLTGSTSGLVHLVATQC